MIIGTVIGVYALVEIYLIKSRLPAGVCPVTHNKPLLYASIILCCISFILSFFETKPKKITDNK